MVKTRRAGALLLPGLADSRKSMPAPSAWACHPAALATLLRWLPCCVGQRPR